MEKADKQVMDGKRALAAWRALLVEAGQRPWLAGLLARQGAGIFSRFAQVYRQMQELPRRLRRALSAKLRRQLATTLLGAALLLALNPAGSAQAATITVDGVTCGLADAISAANTDTATNGCDAGLGADTIDLQVDVTLSSALPALSSEITLQGNGHTIDGAGVSGVLVIDGATVIIEDVTITGGAADNGPGVLTTGAAAVTINDSIISGNSATFNGGGVYAGDGMLTINNSTISGNSAQAGGGGIENYLAATTINNSTISGNSASFGGGVDVYRGSVTVNNSTISGNTATGDGGGFALLNPLVLNNATVTGNTAENGGGVFAYSSYATATLNRSLISGNTANNVGHEVNSDGASLTADNYNVLGYGGSARSTNFTPGPSDIVPAGALNTVLESTLAENNGTTLTHALVTGSAAIDVAPSADCEAAPIDGVDQRGFPRNIDGDASASSEECDAGAFEFGSGPTAISLGFMQAQSAGGGGLLAGLGALALGLSTLGYRLWSRAVGGGRRLTG